MNKQTLHPSMPHQKTCPGDGARPGLATTIPAATLLLLVGFLLTTMPLHATSIISAPKPGDQWIIEILPESARTPLPSAEPKKRPQNPTEKGTSAERNRMGSDFREQATLEPDGSAGSLRVLTGSYVIAKVEGSEKFALDTLNDDMPGGRPVWNRLSEFSWVGIENRKGVVKVDGVDCHIHVQFEDGKPDRPVLLAAISSTDGRPLRLETPDEIRRYVWSHGSPFAMPSGALEALQEFLQEMKRQIQRHNVPR